MTNKVYLQVTIPGETRYLKIVDKICDKICKETSMPQIARESLFNTLNVVLTESIVNVIKHNRPATPHENVKICIELTDKELVIRVYDRGQGFDLKSVPKLNFDTVLLKESGRGIQIIRKLMDSVFYTKSSGVNILEMRKKLMWVNISPSKLKRGGDKKLL